MCGYEKHDLGNGKITKCSEMPVSVHVRDGIGASHHACHPSQEETDDACNVKSDRLPFTAHKIIPGEPNIVAPYRKYARLTVQRDDPFDTKLIYRLTSLVLGVTPRRGEGDPPFHATTPMKNLVYTVVHDPPGKAVVQVDSPIVRLTLG